MTWFKPRRCNSESRAAALPDLTTPESDQAWRVLGLIVDWIRHAEVKAGAILAASGVSGGVLYNLVKTQTDRSVGLNIAAGTAGVLLFLSAFGAAMALRPRLRSSEDPTSKLYYSHIARRYPRPAGAKTYSEALLELTTDEVELVNEIARQIWANAHVAKDKYMWINWALVAFLLGLFSLSAVPVIITLGWTR